MMLNRGFARNAERNIYKKSADMYLDAVRFPERKMEGSRQECVTSIVPVGSRINSMERSAEPEGRR